MKKLVALFLVLAVVSCKKNKKTNEPEPENPFDKSALVSNMADNVIVPAYESFKKSLDSLSSEYAAFKTNPTLAALQVVKQKFQVAYIQYQRVSLFEFGPAETEIVRMNFNVFPTDTVQINSNINAGTYNLDAANNLDAKAFPALEFLLYGLNKSENSVLQEFISSNNKKNYVSDLLLNMSTKLNSLLNAWNSGYKTTFKNSLNTDVGSSIGYMVNQLNFELDYLKNAKIGTPLGKKTLGIAVPASCEAYYNGNSIQLAKETLYAIETLYLGRSQSGNNGIGFDDYLAHLKSNYNGGLLSDAIANQFNLAKTKLNAIPNPLSQQVISNPTIVDEAYVELVKLLVLLKTDMPSNLGVIITYQDGDGD